jgi:nucleoside-diphosphate-sugar epimerase
MVDVIAEEVGRPELVLRGALPDRPEEPPVLVADIVRLRDEVGYRPRWALTDGLLESIRWWEDQAGVPSRRR